MHRRAEFGIAAHWGYKDDTQHPGSSHSSEDMAWLQRIVDWERETPDPIATLVHLDYSEGLAAQVVEDSFLGVATRANPRHIWRA